MSDEELLGVGVVMVSVTVARTRAHEEVERGGLMLALHLRRGRLGYMNVRSQ